LAPRILVVERDRSNLELIREILNPLGGEPIRATSVALGLFLAHKNMPDLILSEVSLAEGDGFDLIRAVKADPELVGIPFVFVCSDSRDDSLRTKGLALGAEKFLFHPLPSQELLDQIRPYLRERRQERAAESPE